MCVRGYDSSKKAERRVKTNRRSLGHALADLEPRLREWNKWLWKTARKALLHVPADTFRHCLSPAAVQFSVLYIWMLVVEHCKQSLHLGVCLLTVLVFRPSQQSGRVIGTCVLLKTRRRLVLSCDAMVVAINVTGMNCVSSKCFVLHLVCRHRLIERTLRRVLASSPAVFHVFRMCTKCDGCKVGLSDEFDTRLAGL